MREGGWGRAAEGRAATRVEVGGWSWVMAVTRAAALIVVHQGKGWGQQGGAARTTAEATRLVADLPSMPVEPSSSWMYFCSLGWPTRPRIAEASEWPISGTVPRNSGAKFLAALSRMISMIGFSAPAGARRANGAG